MKKRILLVVVCLLLSVLNPPLFSQRPKSVKGLPERYQQWLTEDVVYIITPKEKEVFLKLENDRERELFIEAFWKQRDPNPNTPENEFKKEHYRRIAYANQWFGRDTPSAGWRTPMGAIYIMLGEPKSIDKFENLTEIRPTIIWFYQGRKESGLPDAFNVVFFKREFTGDWVFYTPIKYGPQALLYNYEGDQTNYLAAYDQLWEAETAVANISLSLIPGEAMTTPSPSIASEVLINQKIPSAPLDNVKDAYAEEFYKYKDSVGVEYSTNYIENDSAVTVIRDQSGVSFVHFLIEPKRLSMEQVGNKVGTSLQINVLVSDLQGIPVFQSEKTLPVELNEDQVAKIKNKLFSFQDMFPLIEGTYKLSLLLKNAVSKEFTSFETQVVIPPPASFSMSPLVLANRKSKTFDRSGRNKAFLIKEIQLVPSPRNDFTSQETLYLFFQIQGLTDELKSNGFLRYTISDEGKTIFTSDKEIRAYDEVPDFFEAFSLAGFSPSLYKIKVALLNPKKEDVLSKEGDFFISHAPSLPRPFIMSVPLPPSGNPLYDNILGNQYWNKKILAEAREKLEKAYKADPTSAAYARDYSKVLFAARDFQAVKTIAEPFFKDKNDIEFAGLLGQASQGLGEYEAAVAYYQEYLNRSGMNINVLNAIGECFVKLGRIQDALAAWEKSLQLSPKQESIKKLVESLKKKK